MELGKMAAKKRMRVTQNSLGLALAHPTTGSGCSFYTVRQPRQGAAVWEDGRRAVALLERAGQTTVTENRRFNPGRDQHGWECSDKQSIPLPTHTFPFLTRPVFHLSCRKPVSFEVPFSFSLSKCSSRSTLDWFRKYLDFGADPKYFGHWILSKGLIFINPCNKYLFSVIS